jgi:uncharacterized membrane protein
MVEARLEHPLAEHFPARVPLTGLPQNVGPAERLVSAAGGGMLLVAALVKRSRWSRIPLAAAGLALAYRGLTGRSPLYSWLGINRDGSSHPAVGVRARRGFRFETAQTIQCSPEELYRAWRDFEHLPRFLRHLKSVHETGDGRSHWVAEALGGTIEWDAEIINERQNELIAWRSFPGSQLDTAGSIHFQQLEPHDRGTVVHVNLKYDPPAGAIGATIARLFGSGFEQSVREDMRHFKQLMEAGEIPTRGIRPSPGVKGA